MAEGDKDARMGTTWRGTKEGYLVLFFTNFARMGDIIKDMESSTDPRLKLYTKFLISSVTDDDRRYDLREKLKNNLDAIKETNNEKRVIMEHDVCMEVIGDVVAFYDEFLKVTYDHVVGTV